jgi:hypothetical protein
MILIVSRASRKLWFARRISTDTRPAFTDSIPLADKSDYRTTPFPVPHLSGSRVNQALARAASLKATQELLKSGLVLSWGDERGLFVAGTVYLKEAFGRKCSGIHFLAELKGDNGVLTAVDDQNGSVYFL